MRELAVFAAAGVGTYLARAVFILMVGDRPLSKEVERTLRNVGPAVLSALTTSLLLGSQPLDYLTNLPQLLATAGAVFVAWRTRNFLLTFAVGMTVLWVAQALA